MSNIVLIACSKTKLRRPAPAWRLYQGHLFKKSLAYAQTLGAGHIYILSAKYGLIGLSRVVEPYEMTLKTMRASERRQWASHVYSQMRGAQLLGRHAVLLAGQRYREHLIDWLPSYEVPLEGLGIGEQLAWLTKKLEK